MTWIFAYHGGAYHLTGHIPVVSTSCRNTMHTILAYTRSVPQLTFQHYDMLRPRSFTMAYATPHEVLIDLYKSIDLYYIYKPPVSLDVKLHHYIMLTQALCYLPSFSRNTYLCFCFLLPMAFSSESIAEKNQKIENTLST